ncbi:MAG: zinc ribbon domain-containing protein [Bryobacteraceae bacterium]
MPIYEYRCAKCGGSFEKLRKIQDADAPTECPYCESEETERQLSTFSSGFGCCSAPSASGFR